MDKRKKYKNRELIYNQDIEYHKNKGHNVGKTFITKKGATAYWYKKQINKQFANRPKDLAFLNEY